MPNTTESTARLEQLLEPITDHMLDGDTDAAGIIVQAARDTAALVNATGKHATVFSPGNGWTYKIVTVLLPDQPTGVRAVDSWGGNLLISLPDFHACALFNSTGGFHMPSYVDEKMRLGAQHSAVVAAFATLVDSLLTP